MQSTLLYQLIEILMMDIQPFIMLLTGYIILVDEQKCVFATCNFTHLFFLRIQPPCNYEMLFYVHDLSLLYIYT